MSDQPKIVKFGTINENDKGDLALEGFEIDFAWSPQRVRIVVFELMIARFEEELRKEREPARYTWDESS